MLRHPTSLGTVYNRTQKTSTLPGYPGGLSNHNANDELTTDTYDANGNTTSSIGKGYVYDFENHLIQAGGVTYTYDGDGDRISKTVAGTTTTYLLDTQSPTGYTQAVQDWVSSGWPSIYTYGLEQISMHLLGSGIDKKVYYVHDGHGSARALTDATGTVTDTYDCGLGLILAVVGTPDAFGVQPLRKPGMLFVLLPCDESHSNFNPQARCL